MGVRGALPHKAEGFLHTHRLNFIDLFFIDHALHSVLELLFLPVYNKCLNSTSIVHWSINFCQYLRNTLITVHTWYTHSFILWRSIITMIIFSKSLCFNGNPLVPEFIWKLSRFNGCYHFVAAGHEWVNVNQFNLQLYCMSWSLQA